MRWIYSSSPKLQWLHRWSFGMDKCFVSHLTGNVITYPCWDWSSCVWVKVILGGCIPFTCTHGGCFIALCLPSGNEVTAYIDKIPRYDTQRGLCTLFLRYTVPHFVLLSGSKAKINWVRVGAYVMTNCIHNCVVLSSSCCVSNIWCSGKIYTWVTSS